MTIGVAVIGAGMAGRAHAAAYRTAPTLYESTLPPLRFVSIGDVSPEFGVAGGPALRVRAVRHLVAGDRRRPRHPRGQRRGGQLPAPRDGRGPAGAGKHVLCEKPLSDTLDDARAMADAAARADTVVRIGFTFRRAPGVAALRELVTSGRWVGSCTSTSGTGATTPATRRGRSAGASRAPRAPARSPTSAATPPTWPSSSPATSRR